MFKLLENEMSKQNYVISSYCIKIVFPSKNLICQKF